MQQTVLQEIDNLKQTVAEGREQILEESKRIDSIR